jgi:hypothetical protein
MVLRELIKWSKSLPPWQQDAMRRLWTKGALENDDIDELFLLLKKEHGIAVTRDQAVPTARPLAEDNMPTEGRASPDIRLVKLTELENINAVAPGQTIDFAPEGITIIYGDNATGKSGYSRVLKSACRARGEIDNILPNVFAKRQLGSVNRPKAAFKISLNNDKVKTIEWTEGNRNLEYLTEISIFDAKCARAYIDDQNEVIYIPYGLDILKDLVQLCDTLRDRINLELASLGPIPEMINELVGEDKPIPILTFNSSRKEVDSLTQFNDADTVTLKSLEKKHAELIANDPEEKSKDISRKKRRYERFRKEIILLKANFSNSRISNLRNLYDKLKAAELASELAASQTFENEPLSGVGSDAWKVMFEAAKEYSEKFAYKGETFPVTKINSRCVLCHQLLNTEAKERLQRFWDFVQADIATKLRNAKTEFNNAQVELSNLNLIPEQRDLELFEEIHEDSPESHELLKQHLKSVRSRASEVTKAMESGKWENISSFNKSPVLYLTNKIKHFALEIEKLNEKSQAEEKILTEDRLSSVKLKNKAHKSRPVLYNYLDRIKHENRLHRARNACLTTSITNQHSKLTEKALTEDLRKALHKELSEFGLEYIKLDLERAGIKGSTYHQLKFRGDCRTSLSRILSEGEHRIISIASFLAELNLSPNLSAIVFDDPVSSLDHVWRDRVAERLVCEARKRQVIIFTHDIYFLNAIFEEAALQQVALAPQTVRRTKNKVGLRESGLPWKAKRVSVKLESLDNLAKSLSKLEEDNYDEYEMMIMDGYSKLRNAWESMVEEELLYDVINRFQREVKTQKLRYVEILDDDYKLIFYEIKKCSKITDAHSGAFDINPPLPTVNDFIEDISILRDFIKRLKTRRKEVELRRQKLTEPPNS